MRCDFHFALWKKEDSLVMKSLKLKAISISVSYSVFRRVSNLRAGAAVNLEQFTGSWREMDFSSFLKLNCVFVGSWHSVLLHLCGQQVPRVVTTFSLMWLPCSAAWCFCPGRAVLLPHRRKNCIPFVNIPSVSCGKKSWSIQEAKNYSLGKNFRAELKHT